MRINLFLIMLVLMPVVGSSKNFNEYSSDLVINSDDLNEIKRIRTIRYPIDSNFYSECREKNSEKKCREISSSKNYSYSATEFFKEFPNTGIFTEDVKVKSLNADNFRFISKNNNTLYSIVEKYVDTDEEAISEFYLITVKPKIIVEKIGNYYSIDSSGLMSYKDTNGKLLKKNLK